MTLPFRLVSADSHVVEPPDLWTTRIDRRFADKAPRIIAGPAWDYFSMNGRVKQDPPERQSIGLVATRRKCADPEARDFGFSGRWSEVPEGAYDPLARLKVLDAEGIEAELLYTSFGLPMFGIPDHEFRFACFQAYNNWLAEFCTAAPHRLFGIAMIATDDIARDVAELERCARAGHRGAMVSIALRSGQNYDAASFAPFWAAAEALAMPISLHVAATETGNHATGNAYADFSCMFTPTMYAVTAMIFSGLFDRHPKLKLISVENDASWPLAVLERMDDRWSHDRAWSSGAGLTSGRMPSQVFHDQVACTFMRDRTAIVNRDIIGTANIMWGSDYPHFDGAWPGCAEQLEKQFSGVPPADQIRIGRNNAIEFYDLPLERTT